MTPSETSIAEGLSEAQRAFLHTLPAIGSNNPMRWKMHLCDHGLADCTVQGDEDGERWSFTITPKGERIRSYLISKGS